MQKKTGEYGSKDRLQPGDERDKTQWQLHLYGKQHAAKISGVHQQTGDGNMADFGGTARPGCACDRDDDQ